MSASHQTEWHLLAGKRRPATRVQAGGVPAAERTSEARKRSCRLDRAWFTEGGFQEHEWGATEGHKDALKSPGPSGAERWAAGWPPAAPSR